MMSLGGQRNCSNEKTNTNAAKGSKRICIPIDKEALCLHFFVIVNLMPILPRF